MAKVPKTLGSQSDSGVTEDATTMAFTNDQEVTDAQSIEAAIDALDGGFYELTQVGAGNGVTKIGVSEGAVMIGDGSDEGEELDVGATAGGVPIGDGAGDVTVHALSGDATMTAGGVVTATQNVILPMAVFGIWAVDGDGARTNGAGLAGDDAAPTLTNAAAAFAKAYDHNTTTYSNVALDSALTGWAANYQITADAASEAVEDACYFGAALPFCEIAFDLSQLATWGGDGAIWEYYDGATWSTLTNLYDSTDTTAQDGLRPFQQVGAMAFVPPTDWATVAVDSQTAYWIRSRITATQVTQEPILNSVQHDIVSPTTGWSFAHDMTITGWRLVDGATTLHTATDVKYFLMNYTAGTSSALQTFPQDDRVHGIDGLSLDYTSGDELGFIVIQEDGTNEVTNALVELKATLA